ncbi:OmpA family protein [Alcanivorax sp.]|jgi:outer membrane protein OmpA-like peptidoglycan-associated protein|uniref:OmpA family protein n=1 Tax=Alcanivorax sp. TaxID=1872427 RepID=UPI0032D924A1
MKKINMLIVVAMGLSLVLSGCATQNDDNPWAGYRTDGDGNLLKTSEGRCWRTAQWTAEMAVPECDVAITGEPDVPVPVELPGADMEEPVAVPAPMTVVFTFDSASLSDASRIALKAWYQSVAALKSPSVEMHGYSDPLGGDVYNRDLAERRAQAVAQWWQQQGDSIAEVTVIGHGEDHSVTGARCESLRGDALKQCHQQDRRVQLVARSAAE